MYGAVGRRLMHASLVGSNAWVQNLGDTEKVKLFFPYENASDDFFFRRKFEYSFWRRKWFATKYFSYFFVAN